MSHRPLVSIIVPSRNQARYIRETLDSILAQDYRPLEILVLDGASSDGTVQILEEYARRAPELRWWSERDQGVADAVNRGLALAGGVYAGIQSSDDVYLPGAVREAVTALEQQPDAGIACGDMEIVDEQGRLLTLSGCRLPFTQARFLSRSTLIHQSSAFFRLDLARQLGGWNGRYFCADAELWLRMSFRAPVLKLDRTWSAWRTHPGQRDKDAARMWEAWGHMVRESEDLRRAPLRLRLAARAGRRLMVLGYNPRGRWFATLQAWLAILTYPPSHAGIYDKRVLFPGLARFFGS